jgi:hypothetical protein
MIQGIFYARFLLQEGPRVIAQSPPDLIGSSPSTKQGTLPNSNNDGGIGPGSISSLQQQPDGTSYLLNFDVLSNYIIPRKSFCNRLLATTTPDSKFVILGFPVLIPDEAKYRRNEFIFNFCVVIEEGVERVPYERVVRRLAVTFAEMEKLDGYLSGQDGSGRGQGGRRSDGDLGDSLGDGVGGRRSLEGLLEIIREDLNNYGECMIPVGKFPSLKCV